MKWIKETKQCQEWDDCSEEYVSTKNQEYVWTCTLSEKPPLLIEITQQIDDSCLLPPAFNVHSFGIFAQYIGMYYTLKAAEVAAKEYADKHIVLVKKMLDDIVNNFLSE